MDPRSGTETWRQCKGRRVQIQRKIRELWLTFIKYTLNHLTRWIARRSVGPFSIIRHVGRRSGARYETPIIAQPIDGGFMIALTYGTDVDWYKNVLAAGGCSVLRHRQAYAVDQITPLDAESGRAAFPLPQRLILHILGIEHFVELNGRYVGQA